jgi:hypothetical protein
VTILFFDERENLHFEVNLCSALDTPGLKDNKSVTLLKRILVSFTSLQGLKNVNQKV